MKMSLMTAITRTKQKHAAWKLKHKLKLHVVAAHAVVALLVALVPAVLLSVAFRVTVAQRVVVEPVVADSLYH
jgi:hypothetical protein